MILYDKEAFFENPKDALFEIYDILSCDYKFYPTDFYTNAILNRAMAINDAFTRLAKLGNYVAAAPYIRMQMDNCISAYAGMIIDDKDMFKFLEHFAAGKPLYKFRDARKNPLYEKYIVQELNKKYPLFKKSYEYYNDAVHLSNRHFRSSHYMEDGKMKFAFNNGRFHNEIEANMHNDNMYGINRYLAHILLAMWHPYKLSKLEEMNNLINEGSTWDDIMRDRLHNCPELKKLF